MITTCTECQAKYQLDAEKIPPRVIKVRCPSCSGVFSLDGSKAKNEEAKQQDEPLGLTSGFGDFSPPAPEPPTPEPRMDTRPAVTPDSEPSMPAVRTEAPASPVEAPVASMDTPTPEPAAAPAATVDPVVPAEDNVEPVVETEAEAAVSEPATSVAVMDEPVERKSRRNRRSKEEMLARALVSDIMVYNRDLYDRAKEDGNLLEALGAEIKKSWELYKEKVTPEVANSSNHFRDALNDILAEGEKIF